MATANGVQAVLGLTGLETQSGGVRVLRERYARVDLPQRFGAEHVGLMQKDLEILAGIVKQYPEDVLALQNAVLGHDFATANRLASKIGLTEDKIAANGGGLVGAILGGIALLVVFGLLLESDTPVPPDPQPTPTTSPEGGVDAGTG
jgi:hypothetical protein